MVLEKVWRTSPKPESKVGSVAIAYVAEFFYCCVMKGCAIRIPGNLTIFMMYTKSIKITCNFYFKYNTSALKG